MKKCDYKTVKFLGLAPVPPPDLCPEPTGP